ncbi:MAG: class I SAM-dependent methyltransferase [Actinobacteria bacterium]|nr:class I SAM-dependent methyltransferase [Actinomycetota bacterium]
MASVRDTRWVAAEFDRRAATYDKSATHKWQAQQAAQLLGSQQGLVLDVATGTGLAAASVTDLSKFAHVVGVDVSRAMLNVANRRKNPRCRYVQADASRFPFAAMVFDAVLCVAAIPYLPDLSAAVHQWRRVTRSAGALVFTTPAADGIAVNRLLRHAAAQHGLAVPDPHADLGTPERVTARAQQLGLAVERIDQQSFPDPVGDDPQAAFNKVLDYGFAEPLRAAPLTLREAIYASYRDAHLTHARTGQGEHAVLFTRCHFHPEPAP